MSLDGLTAQPSGSFITFLSLTQGDTTLLGWNLMHLTDKLQAGKDQEGRGPGTPRAHCASASNLQGM